MGSCPLNRKKRILVFVDISSEVQTHGGRDVPVLCEESRSLNVVFDGKLSQRSQMIVFYFEKIVKDIL